MTDNHLSIHDESGDKKYFTLVPNYVLNHSSAIDQSLYLQMKRFAGENGKCTASKNTLMKKMGIGEKAFNKSLKYLLDHKWVEYSGISSVMTPGGVQNIKTYKIIDIWKQNVNFYEGGAESNHPVKVVSEVAKGGVESTPKVVSKVGIIENKYNKEHNKIIDKSITTFGNADINEILSLIKNKFSLPALDGSEKVNRQYAFHLIRKMKSVQSISTLIDMALSDPWYSKNITSVKDLYYNAVKIASRKRGGAIYVED